LNATLGAVFSVTFDRQGNLLMADQANHTVMRVNPDGTLTVVAATASRATRATEDSP